MTPAQREAVNAVIAANWQGGSQPLLNASQFADWYASTNPHNGAWLHRVMEGTSDHDEASVDATRTATPGLTSWALSDSLASFYLSDSDLERSVAISRIVMAATEHWRSSRPPLAPESWMTQASVRSS